MAVLVGEIVEGTVEKITNYGAFVSLPDGRRGLIHISEIADKFVKEISQFIKERQKVKVKILNVSPDGRKIDLSLKQAQAGTHEVRSNNHNNEKEIESLYNQIRGRRQKTDEPVSSFEEKLSRFLKSSEERLADLKKNIESKRGGGKSRI